MTRKELDKLKKAVEKYKADISFSADKLIAEIESIGLAHVEFEVKKVEVKEELKAPW